MTDLEKALEEIARLGSQLEELNREKERLRMKTLIDVHNDLKRNAGKDRKLAMVTPCKTSREAAEFVKQFRDCNQDFEVFHYGPNFESIQEDQYDLVYVFPHPDLPRDSPIFFGVNITYSTH